MAVFLASNQGAQHHRPDDQRRWRLCDALVICTGVAKCSSAIVGQEFGRFRAI